MDGMGWAQESGEMFNWNYVDVMNEWMADFATCSKTDLTSHY